MGTSFELVVLTWQKFPSVMSRVRNWEFTFLREFLDVMFLKKNCGFLASFEFVVSNFGRIFLSVMCRCETESSLSYGELVTFFCFDSC
jgi:hypothetical protein